jgi:hypothetical protein
MIRRNVEHTFIPTITRGGFMGIQIPDLHVSSRSKAAGIGEVFIASRQDASHTGRFIVRLNVAFDPTTQDYPTGNLTMKLSLTDSIKGTVTATTIDQDNSFGKHTPTTFITGRCSIQPEEHVDMPVGSHFWILIANNKPANAPGTQDVVSFVIFDRTGTRVAYGTGPAVQFDIVVDPQSI